MFGQYSAQGGARVADRAIEQFIYLVGEQQEAIYTENEDVLAFTRQQMGQVETRELAMVIANVFAKNQYFPGPAEALTSVVHEFVRRSDRYRLARERKKSHCTLVTAFKRFDGEIAVRIIAVIPLPPKSVSPEQPGSFHDLLIDTLPDYQDAFLEDAYARDSKLVELIKETTLHHIQGVLQ